MTDLTTRDTRPLIRYAMRLEQEVLELRTELEAERAESRRLRELRIRDREIAAYYRGIVEGDVA